MPRNLIEYDQWLCTGASQTDKVCINDLAVNAMAGLDCWRRKKEQPVYISLTLSFRGEFFTASTRDVVDQSTVHYGKLGKNIIATISEKSKAQEWLSSGDLAALIEKTAQRTAGDASLISTCIVDLSYPKGSLYGERAGYRYCVAYNADVYATTLYLENIRLPIILGVNEYERKKKQLIVASLWLDKIDRESIDDHTALEETFIKIIEDTSYETLEALLSHVTTRMMQQYVNVYAPGASIRIRLEKPRALTFADAPGVEMCRHSQTRAIDG